MRDTLSCFQRIIIINSKLVTIAKWIHLFPSRTQKLSTFTPKIVYAKIGSCQFFFALFFISFILGFLEKTIAHFFFFYYNKDGDNNGI